MKIVCIDVSKLPAPTLTEGKFYTILFETGHWYEIIDDSGFSAFHDKWRFISIYKYRNIRINEILN